MVAKLWWKRRASYSQNTGWSSPSASISWAKFKNVEEKKDILPQTSDDEQIGRKDRKEVWIYSRCRYTGGTKRIRTAVSDTKVRRHLLLQKDKEADGVTWHPVCKRQIRPSWNFVKTCKNQRLRYMGWLPTVQRSCKPDRGWILRSPLQKRSARLVFNLEYRFAWPLTTEIHIRQSPTSPDQRQANRCWSRPLWHINKEDPDHGDRRRCKRREEVERCNCWAKRTPSKRRDPIRCACSIYGFWTNHRSVSDKPFSSKNDALDFINRWLIVNERNLIQIDLVVVGRTVMRSRDIFEIEVYLQNDGYYRATNVKHTFTRWFIPHPLKGYVAFRSTLSASKTKKYVLVTLITKWNCISRYGARDAISEDPKAEEILKKFYRKK